jgi:glycosyltransferase involved in cell wall biosynthesis
MRVLLITSTLSEKSGWGRLSRATADALRSAGAEVSVITDEKDWTPTNFLRTCLQARKQAAGAEVVHALDGWPYGVYGLAAVLGTRKKLFINGIGTYSIAPLYSFIRGTLLRLAYARARRIFCISVHTEMQLKKAGIVSQKLTVVHLGTSTLLAVSQKYAEEVRALNHIPPDAYPILLTVGAVKDRKGQLDTLKAAMLLKEKYPHIFYVAAGAAEQRAYVQEMRGYAEKSAMKGNFLMIEHADDQTISALYALADVFALNSTSDDRTHHFEGFGLVLLEANRFGKPAVGSRGSGIEDAIKDGYSGFLTAQRDPQDIADKIEKILAGYHSFSANAKLFSAGFSWEKTARAYLRLYTA